MIGRRINRRWWRRRWGRKDRKGREHWRRWRRRTGRHRQRHGHIRPSHRRNRREPALEEPPTNIEWTHGGIQALDEFDNTSSVTCRKTEPPRIVDMERSRPLLGLEWTSRPPVIWLRFVLVPLESERGKEQSPVCRPPNLIELGRREMRKGVASFRCRCDGCRRDRGCRPGSRTSGGFACRRRGIQWSSRHGRKKKGRK